MTANNNTGGLLAWEFLADALNCSSTPDVLACARAAPATTIKSIIEHAALDFAPVTDNVTQVSDPATRRAERNIALVPVFSGSNSQEGRVFEVGQNNVTAYVQNLFATVPTALQDAIIAAYPIGSPGIANDYEAISQIFTDVEFQCVCISPFPNIDDAELSYRRMPFLQTRLPLRVSQPTDTFSTPAFPIRKAFLMQESTTRRRFLLCLAHTRPLMLPHKKSH